MKTNSGFEYSVNDRIIQDFRFVKLMSKAISEETAECDRVLALCEAAEFVLGKEQLDNLYKHVSEKNDGVADFQNVSSEIAEIIIAQKKI